MILLYAQNPLDGSLYTFSKKQIRLTAPNARVGATQRVWGAHGVIDAFNGYDDPMDAVNLTYQFRLFPRDAHTTLDTMKRSLYQAVAHGLPQTLYFRDDEGTIWYGIGKTQGNPVDISVNSPLWQDVQVTWRLNNPFLRLSHQQGDLLWGDSNANGTAVLWGQSALVWGQTANSVLLTSASQDIVVHNPLAGVATFDITFTFQPTSGHSYGPATPGDPLNAGPDPAGISIINNDYVLNGRALEVRVLTNLASVSESAVIDLAHRAAYKVSGASIAPLWRAVWVPATQRGKMAFKPGDNRLTVSIKGSALASPTAFFSATWYPRTLL